MKQFADQMRSFLEQYQLPLITVDGYDGWTHFLHLYTQVIQDTPLMIGSRRPAVAKEPIPRPKHITHIVVKCELANAPIEDDGVREMLYRIWWTLHMDDTGPESFWILNSFGE